MITNFRSKHLLLSQGHPSSIKIYQGRVATVAAQVDKLQATGHPPQQILNNLDNKPD